jgi:hypothetical protein
MDEAGGDGMEIHKPKAAHSFGEFAREMMAVILGILIALGLEQAVEARHWANLVREGRAELNEELGVQVHNWAYRVRNHPCHVQRLQDVQALLNNLDAGRRVASVAAFETPYGASAPEAVWRSLSASGVLVHMDRKELLILSQIYSTDDHTPTWSAANDSDWSTISLIVGDPNRLPLSDRNLIRVAVSRELLLEQVWNRAGQDQIERARKLGVDVQQALPAGYSTGGPECLPLKLI